MYMYMYMYLYKSQLSEVHVYCAYKYYMYMSGLHFKNLLREGQKLNLKDFERGIYIE